MVLAVLAMMAPARVNAQPGPCSNPMYLALDKVTLEETGIDVELDISSNDSPVMYTVSFLQTESNSVQNHIDYNFILYDLEGKEIFNAASAAGQQSVLHTAEGVVSFSPTLNTEGKGLANVTVYGINFGPIEPHTASFPCIPIPEFPMAAIGVLAAIMTTMVIVLSRYKKLTN